MDVLNLPKFKKITASINDIANQIENLENSGVDGEARQAIQDLEGELDNKADKTQVLTDVPANAVFTDTITTINGKTGAISKADIVALGIPAQDTVYTHPANHSMSEVEGLQTLANQVNSAPKFEPVDDWPVDPEEGVIYFRVVLPEDPEDPEEPEDPNIVKYYTEGVENVTWVVGYSSADETYGTQSKEEDHLYLEIFDKIGAATNRTYVTDEPIDVTSLEGIEIDYESFDAASTLTMRFGVTSLKDSSNSSSNYAAKSDFSGVDPRSTILIDVSSLTGEYYIRVCVMNSSSTESKYGKLKVYNVRGVKNV